MDNSVPIVNRYCGMATSNFSGKVEGKNPQKDAVIMDKFEQISQMENDFANDYIKLDNTVGNGHGSAFRDLNPEKGKVEGVDFSGIVKVNFEYDPKTNKPKEIHAKSQDPGYGMKKDVVWNKDGSIKTVYEQRKIRNGIYNEVLEVKHQNNGVLFYEERRELLNND